MKHSRIILLLVLLISAFLCCSCGKHSEDAGPATGSMVYEPGKTTVLTPVTGEKDKQKASPLTLDFSHSDQGYFIGQLSEDMKINIQVTGPDQVTYKYFFDTAGQDVVFPFTAGSGVYIILAFKNMGNDQYMPLISYSLDVQLQDDFLPFLYPNQYVTFTAESEAIHLAGELTKDDDSDLKALNTIYQYVTEHIVYDDEKAATVESGYLPDIDQTLSEGKGICFDYAALTVAMLRSLSIPARLNIGYSGDIRHAWVDVYIESMGWVENVIQFSGDEWHMMDPTFAAALSIQKAAEYSKDTDNYILEYVR